MQMDSMNGSCSFDGFRVSRACVPGKTFTCAHGKTLGRRAVRRALGLLPLFVYVCTHNERHVAWERNHLGAETPCGQCGGPSVRLLFHDVQERGLVRFVDRSQFRLSS